MICGAHAACTPSAVPAPASGAARLPWCRAESAGTATPTTSADDAEGQIELDSSSESGGADTIAFSTAAISWKVEVQGGTLNSVSSTTALPQQEGQHIVPDLLDFDFPCLAASSPSGQPCGLGHPGAVTASVQDEGAVLEDLLGLASTSGAEVRPCAGPWLLSDVATAPATCGAHSTVLLDLDLFGSALDANQSVVGKLQRPFADGGHSAEDSRHPQGFNGGELGAAVQACHGIQNQNVAQGTSSPSDLASQNNSGGDRFSVLDALSIPGAQVSDLLPEMSASSAEMHIKFDDLIQLGWGKL